eukprot:TRINITY_DN34631_c0_g1_i1.p1 TRINITY_DN34631_c0_g1~~TRINITY_DN34631_c0_g1_i1.p1  ORF type:complete len:499 (-),score=106.00 TRINITY_DN34631_c0_g1_i1:34-1530(-)
MAPKTKMVGPFGERASHKFRQILLGKMRENTKHRNTAMHEMRSQSIKRRGCKILQHAERRCVGERGHQHQEVTSNTPGHSAPADIPEERVRAEIQFLLVGLDLASTTLGELKNKLHERLGLTQGSLLRRKRNRRRINFLVQHEVFKRTQRSASCEKIVQELWELSDYPLGSRQMLIDSLPHALAVEPHSTPVVLHPHQVQLLFMTQAALEDGRKSLLSKEATQESIAWEAEEELRSHEAKVSAAAKALGAAEASDAHEQQLLQDLWSETEEVANGVDALNAKLLEVVAECEKLRSKRATAAAMCDGSVEVLASGACASQQERQEAFDTVRQHLMETGAEPSLLKAGLGSLWKLPAERSDFQSMAVGSVQALLRQQLEGTDAQLEQQLRMKTEAEVAKMSQMALLGAVQHRLEQQGEAASKARDAREVAQRALSEAEVVVESLRARATEHRCSQAHVSAKLHSLGEALALLETAMTSPIPMEDKEQASAPHEHQQGDLA